MRQPHYHHWHSLDPTTRAIVCCHCGRARELPDSVELETTASPHCGAWLPTPLVPWAHEAVELPEVEPRYQPTTEDREEMEAYTRWAEQQPADDITREARRIW